MSGKLDELGVSAFCESMAMMQNAGIQTDEAISLLRKGGGQQGLLEQTLQTMEGIVEQGGALHEAMEQSGAFPAYAVKMIAAGEGFGRLEDVLRHLAAYYADQKTIREKLRSAILYPAVMLGLVIAMLAVMLAVVLPVFTGVYENLAGSLTASSYGYISWAYGFCYLALAALVLLAAALVTGLLLWKGGKRSAVIAVLRKIPVSRAVLESMAMFRFTSSLEIFLASGEMQDAAVANSIEMVDYAPVKTKLERCLDRMQEGHGIAQAAYEEELFEPVYGRMLLAGERSGSMETVLKRLTGLLEENCGSLVDRLVSVVDPLLSGALMLTIGLSLISVMLPLIGMMNAIG